MSLLPRIAVVGAGPAGLLLGCRLHQAGIPFQLFEADAGPDTRGQGGMLDLHAATGQAALRSAGLFERFQQLARYEDQGLRMFDAQGRLLLDDDGLEGDRPEIDRGHLRDLLLGALPADCVRWGHALREAVVDGKEVVLQFGNGVIERFDLAVGADGAWSRLRPLLTDVRPRHAGISLYELSLRNVDVDHPQLAALVGRGTLVAKGGARTLFAQRNADARVRVYASLPQVLADGAPAPRETRESLLAHFADWHPDLRRLIAEADAAVRPWPIHMLPVGHRWDHRSAVTLIGDAAHVMPPAGEGANLALRDAADLADALCTPDWRAAVQVHEQGMVARAAESAAAAQRMLVAGSVVQMLAEMRGDLETVARASSGPVAAQIGCDLAQAPPVR
ncbi:MULTISPECIES: NAD(P)/FAD-dependent oxidoreductase [unclassified Stenotrophomonas]|uniref:FAD-dependent oxidoreductase n=1 Tax=unclassified Stenotrophomonas TaxID=196198 RepID=UPI0021197562